jgi:hypothetical protein
LVRAGPFRAEERARNRPVDECSPFAQRCGGAASLPRGASRDINHRRPAWRCSSKFVTIDKVLIRSLPSLLASSQAPVVGLLRRIVALLIHAAMAIHPIGAVAHAIAAGEQVGAGPLAAFASAARGNRQDKCQKKTV